MDEQAARWSGDRDGVPSGVPQLADAAAVRAVADVLHAAAALHDVDPSALSANGLLEYTGLLANLARLVEGKQVGNVGEIARRSSIDAGLDGLAARHGSASPAALFEKITGAKNSAAYRYSSLAKRTTPRLSDTGELLPPLFPHTARALENGVIGVDAAEAITATLNPAATRAHPDDLDAAERILVGNAIGDDGGIPQPADTLRAQARLFRDRIDPDGIEPSIEAQHQARSLTFHQRSDGMLKLNGLFSPEQATIITPVFDAYLSPRTAPAFLTKEELAAKDAAPEQRTKPQERADVFTALIEAAGKHPDTPTLHGRGPTVLVTITADDLNRKATHDTTGSSTGIEGTGITGTAVSPGTPEPLPASFAQQMRCDGDTHHVTLDTNGNVLDLGRAHRYFTPKQRLALIARDGPTCAADNCTIPAWLAEAHHITGWADNGHTNIDNAILVCWFHHRLIERGEWGIEKQQGRPRIVPPTWYPHRTYLRPRKPPQRE